MKNTKRWKNVQENILFGKTFKNRSSSLGVGLLFGFYNNIFFWLKFKSSKLSVNLYLVSDRHRKSLPKHV